MAQRCAHTYFRKGQRVFIVLNDGTRMTAKFQERQSKYVTVKINGVMQKIFKRNIRSMSIKR